MAIHKKNVPTPEELKSILRTNDMYVFMLYEDGRVAVPMKDKSKDSKKLDERSNNLMFLNQV